MKRFFLLALLSVPAAADPPAVVANALPDATEMVPYAFSLEATGGEAPLAWSTPAGGFLALQEETSSFAETGTAQGWKEDDASWELELPFAFPFYGDVWTNVYVNDNGTLSFGKPLADYNPKQDTFVYTPMIAPLWSDVVAVSSVEDVYVESSTNAVTVRWARRYYSRRYYPYNFSATLFPDGDIVFAYGSGNARGGLAGVSAGDGERAVVLANTTSSFGGVDDFYLHPSEPPPGFSLAADGTLSGVAPVAGTYRFSAVVQDASNAWDYADFGLVVVTNENLRPVIDAASPTGGVVLRLGETETFSVETHDPDGDPLSFDWRLDGTPLGAADTNFTFEATAELRGLHVLECIVEDGLWTNVVRTAWYVRVLKDSYVDASAPQGGDGSAAAPFTAIGEALADVRDYETIHVAPGTYGSVIASISALDVMVQATDGPATTIIDGGGTNVCCGIDLDSGSSFVCYDGFTLVNGAGMRIEPDPDDEFGGPTAYYGGGAYSAILSRCVISNCTATYGGGAYCCYLYNCRLVGNAAKSFSRYDNPCGGGADSCDLYDCLLADNKAEGTAGGARYSYLSGCTVVGNAANAGTAGLDRNCTAVNCIAWGNLLVEGDTPDFEIGYGSGAKLSYCCTGQATAGEGNFSADPRFMDATAGDYRLRSGSPCLDQGTASATWADELDLAGNARVQGEAPDIGAFEGVGGVIPIRVVSDSEAWFSAVAQTGCTTVAADTDWSVSATVGWIEPSDSSGSGDGTTTFALAPNETGSGRTARLVFEDMNGAVATQTVRQAAATAPPALPGRYYGLFVGVNVYTSGSGLRGCVVDATNMRDRFTDWGYCARTDATLLTDETATLAAVRAAMADLAAKAVPGDTVFFYQSSHGTQQTDTTVVGLCEHDGTYWDYQLAADLGRFADGVRVVVMADTCNSGGLFKGAKGTATRPRFDLAPRVLSIMDADRAAARRPGLKAGAAARNLSAPADVAFVTAADYDQYSLDGAEGGRFTTACLAAWASGAADSDGDGRISFFDLWFHARDAAGNGGATEAQCFNEELLLDVLAGVTDASTAETETFGSPARVPHDWLDEWMPALGYPAGAGGFHSHADYECAANGTKTTPGGASVAVWQDWVAGTCPTNPASVFLADIAVSNGVPVVSWTPDLGAERDYVVLGKSNLLDRTWGPTNAGSRFFQVEVRLK